MVRLFVMVNRCNEALFWFTEGNKPFVFKSSDLT